MGSLSFNVVAPFNSSLIVFMEMVVTARSRTLTRTSRVYQILRLAFKKKIGSISGSKISIKKIVYRDGNPLYHPLLNCQTRLYIYMYYHRESVEMPTVA